MVKKNASLEFTLISCLQFGAQMDAIFSHTETKHNIFILRLSFSFSKKISNQGQIIYSDYF